MSLSESEITRLVHLAKLSESVERYEDMVVYMEKIAKSGHRLSTEERNLLSVAYKNVVASKRSGWRLASSFAIKDSEQGETVLAEADNEYKEKMEKELKTNCSEVLALIESHLMHDEDSEETKIFYLKMRGDYKRYMVEVSTGDEKNVLMQEAEELYKQASEIAQNLNPCNPVRLGLALNFSVFHYEIKESAAQARDIAQQAFALAAPELENLREPEFKDSALILQLLRDNLSLWTDAEENDEELGVQDVQNDD